MASLRRVPNSRNWIACFYDANGNRKQRSTAKRNRGEAQKIADTYEKPYRDKLTGAKVLEVMTEMYRQVAGSDAPSYTLRGYSESWLKRKQPEVKESTYNTYEITLRQFIQYMGARADDQIGMVEQRHVVGWRDERMGKVAAKTINSGIKCLRMFFKAARRDRVVIDNPAEFVEVVRHKRGDQKTEVRPFTLTEIKAILENCDNEWRSMVLFALYTGQRLGDIATLTWSQIDVQKGVVRFTTQKSGRFQELPIPAPLQDHIATLTAQDEPTAPVHPEAFATFEATGKTTTLSVRFADILANAGLRAKVSHKKKDTKGEGRNGRHIRNSTSFHAFRRTATSIMKNAGIPSSVVQDYIGHDSAEMSKLYTTIDMEAKRKAANALPSLNQITGGKQ